MRVKLAPSKGQQTLPEYTVGEATDICLFPGIAQCFAIVGPTQSKLIATHVSPGATAAEIEETFSLLKNLGGDTVMFWYIVGPCLDHFAEAKAQWRSAKDIKKSFSKNLSNKAASHYLLDASDERNTMAAVPGATILSKFNAIDVRATVRGATVAFAYKETRLNVKNWTEFDLTKFQLI
jgi:hypothetical protein